MNLTIFRNLEQIASLWLNFALFSVFWSSSWTPCIWYWKKINVVLPRYLHNKGTCDHCWWEHCKNSCYACPSLLWKEAPKKWHDQCSFQWPKLQWTPNKKWVKTSFHPGKRPANDLQMHLISASHRSNQFQMWSKNQELTGTFWKSNATQSLFDLISRSSNLVVTFLGCYFQLSYLEVKCQDFGKETGKVVM